MAVQVCLTWILLASVTMPPISACLPGLSTFGFGSCPSLAAGNNSDLSLYTGRWYVVQGTVRPFFAPTCVLIDITATNSTSAPIQLGYQYRRFGREKTMDLTLATNTDSAGTYLVQSSGIAALFGQRVLVSEAVSEDVMTLLTCKQAFFGHILSAQVLSRNATVPSSADVSTALQNLQTRGVRTSRLRSISQTNCPESTAADPTSSPPVVEIP